MGEDVGGGGAGQAFGGGHRAVAQHGGGPRQVRAAGHAARRPVEQACALLQDQLGVLVQRDLDLSGALPVGEGVGPRLNSEGPAPLVGEGDVGAVAVGSGGEQVHLPQAVAAAVGGVQDGADAWGVVPLAEHGCPNRNGLAGDGFCRAVVGNGRHVENRKASDQGAPFGLEIGQEFSGCPR